MWYILISDNPQFTWGIFGQVRAKILDGLKDDTCMCQSLTHFDIKVHMKRCMFNSFLLQYFNREENTNRLETNEKRVSISRTKKPSVD